MTRTRAGSTPANSAVGPSLRKRDTSVEMVEGFLEGLPSLKGRVSPCERAVIRVLTTQIGFVISTVALPAIAPAIMDSIVVSFLEARPALIAARSKPARVHSYPISIVNDLRMACQVCLPHNSSIQSLSH